jgi:hypothetical protein
MLFKYYKFYFIIALTGDYIERYLGRGAEFQNDINRITVDIALIPPPPPPPSPPLSPPQFARNHLKSPGHEPLPSIEGCGLNHQHFGMRKTDDSRTRPSPLQRDVGGHILARRWNWGGRNTRGDPKSGRPVQCVAKTGYDTCCSPFFSHHFLPQPPTHPLTISNPTQNLPPTSSLPR